MKIIGKIIILILVLSCSIVSYGAYLTNVPVKLKQPNGKELNIYASGDEFHNWLHDEDGFTIIQDTNSGYYCYAILDGDEIVASRYIVGEVDPNTTDLIPNVNISLEKILDKRNEILLSTPPKPISSRTIGRTTTTLNNIVIYIRFADQEEFDVTQTIYSSMFNNTVSGVNSMRNYFNEVSYNQINVSTTFYPSNNGNTIISYKDIHIRDYYCPFSAVNDSGYLSTERTAREHALLQRAINFVKTQIPTSLNLDYDNDGLVDNICFIIRGGTTGWNDLLWPHKWSLHSVVEYLNDKRVWYYNFQLEDHLSNNGVGVLCHEMGHTLGAPDLYHFNDNIDPVGPWDLMAMTYNPPQHIGTYIKYKYCDWITNVPVITTSGTYTLNPITSASNNCYKIPIKGTSEYLFLEYRKKSGVFENSLPNSGLIIYRINENYNGNSNGVGAGGVTDEVYIYRRNGSINSDGIIMNAYLSSTSGRDSFHNTSNPNCFISNGNLGNIYIKNISDAGNTISFDVRFCDDEDIIFSNTNSLPTLSNASNSISTLGTVTVKSSDVVSFEAGNEVILNGDFNVESGGFFEINMNGCGDR